MRLKTLDRPCFFNWNSDFETKSRDWKPLSDFEKLLFESENLKLSDLSKEQLALVKKGYVVNTKSYGTELAEGTQNFGEKELSYEGLSISDEGRKLLNSKLYHLSNLFLYRKFNLP